MLGGGGAGADGSANDMQVRLGNRDEIYNFRQLRHVRAH